MKSKTALNDHSRLGALPQLHISQRALETHSQMDRPQIMRRWQKTRQADILLKNSHLH